MADGPYERRDWLEGEVSRILAFYYPECLDETYGGYIAQFDEETGAVYDRGSKHLVATSRFVVDFSRGIQIEDGGWCRSAAKHGLEFLLEVQRDTARDGFHWLLDGTDPVDSRRVCYGHAFAFLAVSRAVEADVGDRDVLRSVYELVEDRFWDSEYELYESEYDPEWDTSEPYRGQNANMHMCEAMIAAYEATGESQYLRRAMTLAERVTVDLTQKTDGLIWEHYTPEWEHDFEYNRGDPAHTFRPWGYQPGHQIEWAKLLAVLARYEDSRWLLKRAVDLFDTGMTYGWDESGGGLYYSCDRSGDPIVTDKYAWEVAEAIGAAAALYGQTGQQYYLDWYRRLWKYADTYMINPDSRNWYTKVTEDDEPVPTREGVAVEPGYHPIAACFAALRFL